MAWAPFRGARETRSSNMKVKVNAEVSAGEIFEKITEKAKKTSQMTR
jgi:hypothetical protein